MLPAQDQSQPTQESNTPWSSPATAPSGTPRFMPRQTERPAICSVDRGKCAFKSLTKGTSSVTASLALVAHITACGGNCCPNRFFVSALGNGRFEVGEEFADSWAYPVVEQWKGRWSIVVTSNNEGINLDRPLEITRRFILERGKAVKVEEWRRKDLESIVEMRSEIFNTDDADEMHSVEYDLDGDGKKDQITGRLWYRWGRILWSVQFADGKKFSSDADEAAFSYIGSYEGTCDTKKKCARIQADVFAST